ncbi:MAG TPA: hypothetical protein VHB97_27290, partial [Polyangia bacterium]|nr:hypothetical protein [Polyangia bacterium]
GPLLPLAALEGALSHVAPLDVRFILQVSLIGTFSLLAFVAGTRANERLAKLGLSASSETAS